MSQAESNFGLCRLCKSDKQLKKSHIIPKSYFRSLKAGNGQLLKIVCEKDTKILLGNYDPKEHLFCNDCEQFLSMRYEAYGTRVFKPGPLTRETAQYVELRGFRFKDFYLYLISILWRASISSVFRAVSLPDNLNELMRHSIKNETIKIGTSLRLEHFIKISLVRMTDKTGQIDDRTIRRIFFEPMVEKGNSIDDGIVYYFMVDGFLIIYHLSANLDIHKLRTSFNRAQIMNRNSVKVPIENIWGLTIGNSLITAIEKIAQHNKNKITRLAPK